MHHATTDIDYLVPHQTNVRITDFVARRLGLIDSSQLHNVESVGTTGAAAIPLLLAQDAAAGYPKRGQCPVLPHSVLD
ncbi:3-oxoacyl-[acyl-carrier-protein] synthase III C-terminal domain-containing protein [Streptomyces sp. NPDC002671]